MSGRNEIAEMLAKATLDLIADGYSVPDAIKQVKESYAVAEQLTIKMFKDAGMPI